MSKLRTWGYLAILLAVLPIYAQDEVDYSEMSLEDLLNVEVTTAGKKAQKINEIPASVVVITRADIERHGYARLEDILENVTGLYGIDQREVSGMKFGVRGFWSATANSIIMLINGVRQEPLAADGAAYMNNRVPVESIDRIEVVRGPMSVNYGQGAFFGVINIITNEASSGSRTVASAGTDGTTNVLVKTSHDSGDDGRVVVSAGYRRTDGPDVDYSVMSTHDLLNEFGTRVESTKDRWGERTTFFNASAKFKNFYADANYELTKKGVDLVFPGAFDGGVANRLTQTLSVGYAEEVSEKFNYDAKVTYAIAEVKADWDFFTPVDELNLGGDFNYREGMEIDLTGFFNPTDKISVTAGLYYKKVFHEQLLTVAPLIDYIYRLGLTEPAVSQAAYLQGDFKVNERFSLVVGGRADQSDKYGTYYRIFAADEVTHPGEYTADDVEFLPRFAAIYNLKDRNVFKFLYGKAINRPSTPQNASQGYLEGPDLEPELIETIELVHTFIPSARFASNVSFFYNQLDKLIINDLVAIPGGFAAQNRNAGKIDTKGAEIRLQFAPNDRFDMEVSGMWQDSEDKSENFGAFEVAYSPSILGYLKVGYDLTPNATLGVKGRYVDDMHALYSLSIPGRIAPDVDSYFNLDLDLRFNKIAGSNYYIELLGKNVTDEDYLFPTFNLQSGWADKGLVGNGQYFQLSVGKVFGK